MNKRLLHTAIVVILAYLLSLAFPWWSVMIAALAASILVPLKKSAVFFTPFVAIFVFWALLSYSQGSSNDFNLSNRVAELLYLNGNPYLLILVTGLVGGIAAGVAAILGKQISNFLRSDTT